MRLAGKVAIVTGGASGIGEAVSRLFSAHGAFVMIADIDEAGAMRVASALGDSGSFLRTDVSNADDVKRMVQGTQARFGGVDILFNSAAIVIDGFPVHEYPDDAFDRTMAVNVKGTFLAMKYCVPEMIAAGGGVIINMSSTTAIAGYSGQCAYGASKAAVVQLTRHVSTEVASKGIRVNAICSGGVLGPLVFSRRPDSSREEVIEHFSNTNPMRRAGLPEDIANAALWLASSESSFVTGQAIVVDGGRTASIYRGPSPESYGPHNASSFTV